MSDCIFCEIAAGEIPSATIYEDDDFRVILDMGPATRGHALILPKKHFADVTEISEETAPVLGADLGVGYLELKDFNHAFRILETAALRIKDPNAIVVFE